MSQVMSQVMSATGWMDSGCSQLNVFVPSPDRRWLLGDGGRSLQDASMAPPLPPVGTEVFRRFTPASLEEIQRRHEAEEKEQQRRKDKNIEVLITHLHINHLSVVNNRKSLNGYISDELYLIGR